MDCGRPLPCPDHPTRQRLCAHADQGGEGAHWLEPGERCPLTTTPCVNCDRQQYEHGPGDLRCPGFGSTTTYQAATTTPTPAELLAERFGLEERPNTARAHAIAAIHALADFYAAHPEIPAPWSVRANSSAADMDELRSLAETHGAKVYGSNPLAQQFDITVRRRERGSDVPDMGIIVSVRPPERPL